MKKILVIGSSNIDFVVRVPYMPAVGETIMGHSLNKIPGGKGANQAFACGKLGGDTSFLSTVGDDGLGTLLIENMKAAGVDTSYMDIAQNTPTGMALIYVNDKGDNSIVVIGGANDKCSKEYIARQKKLISECDILMVQMEIPEEGVYYAVKTAKETGKTVILNPAPAPDHIPDEIYCCLDFITPNETELQKLTGCPTDTRQRLIDAGNLLLRRGVKNVLVTLGAQGAMLLNQGGCQFFQPPEVTVKDTTAAGDTFNAAFAVQLAEGKEVQEAVRFANLASSLAVSKAGAQSSVPSRQEVTEFADSLKKNRATRSA